MESFKRLGLGEGLINEIENAKFKEPSEIQKRTIPLALARKDVIAGSATGSGKTLAFGASIIENTERGKGIQALILTPTRELAEQVGKVIRRFSSFKNLEIAIIYGGVGMGPQVDSLRRAEIVVGTPGRILDHLQRGTIVLSKIKTLVLDEADRMLDMGFIEDVERIISQCPKQRQTMLFSATISHDIEHVAHKHMHNPEYVAVESYVDPSLLKQIYYDVPSDLKFSLLLHLLKGESKGLIMVFCNTQRNTDFIANNLGKFEVDATAIHGGLSQMKRNKIMERFHAGKAEVLICTDVAARGLDIRDVSHVYNYDIPRSSKEYIHRIGRTARAGKDGIAISIVSQKDYDNFRNVLRNPDLKIEQEKMPPVEKVNIRFASDGGFHRGSHVRSEGFKRNFGNKQGFDRHNVRRGYEGRTRRFDGNRTHQGNRDFGRDRRFDGNRDIHRGRLFSSRGRSRNRGSFRRRF